MICEDAMFINEHRLASLEYIFFNDDGDYSMLTHCKSNELGTRKIENAENQRLHFQEQPECFQDSKKNYLNPENHLGEDGEKFIETKKKTSKVIALICQWQINKGGQLVKINETSFHYKGTFKKSRRNMMKL